MFGKESMRWHRWPSSDRRLCIAQAMAIVHRDSGRRAGPLPCYPTGAAFKLGTSDFADGQLGALQTRSHFIEPHESRTAPLQCPDQVHEDIKLAHAFGLGMNRMDIERRFVAP